MNTYFCVHGSCTYPSIDSARNPSQQVDTSHIIICWRLDLLGSPSMASAKSELQSILKIRNWPPVIVKTFKPTNLKLREILIGMSDTSFDFQSRWSFRRIQILNINQMFEKVPFSLNCHLIFLLEILVFNSRFREYLL